MSDGRKAEKKIYTYGDSLNWPEDERWEILDGETFAASEVFDVDGLQLEVGVLPGLEVDFGRIFPPRPVVVRESPGPCPG